MQEVDKAILSAVKGRGHVIAVWYCIVKGGEEAGMALSNLMSPVTGPEKDPTGKARAHLMTHVVQCAADDFNEARMQELNR